ncbi:MAG: hypothetical protein V3R68_05430 [Gammaproteobacteria bacterium]
MERKVLMRERQAKAIIYLLCLCVASINGTAQTTQRRLLLVCSMESTTPSLSHKEVRKLFLGAPVLKNNVRLRPLRNASDPLLTEVFLQKIIFMSKRNYERQLVSRVFRLGGERPPVYTNIPELIDELRQSPQALTYMWADQLALADNVKSIGVLWEGTVE